VELHFQKYEQADEVCLAASAAGLKKLPGVAKEKAVPQDLEGGIVAWAYCAVGDLNRLAVVVSAMGLDVGMELLGGLRADLS